MLARDKVGEIVRSGVPDKDNLKEFGLYTTQGMKVGISVAGTAVGIADQVVLGGAETASIGARAVPVAARALGVVGAVVSTGVAVHGWVTTKGLQETCRSRLTSVNSATVATQRWLAAMSQLECSICLGAIELHEEARCCSKSWHYAHAHCLGDWEKECEQHGRPATCPLCCGPLSLKRGVLQDLMVEDIQNYMNEAQL